LAQGSRRAGGSDRSAEGARGRDARGGGPAVRRRGAGRAGRGGGGAAVGFGFATAAGRGDGGGGGGGGMWFEEVLERAIAQSEGRGDLFDGLSGLKALPEAALEPSPSAWPTRPPSRCAACSSRGFASCVARAAARGRPRRTSTPSSR
jgi:hypothetical protein